MALSAPDQAPAALQWGQPASGWGAVHVPCWSEEGGASAPRGTPSIHLPQLPISWGPLFKGHYFPDLESGQGLCAVQAGARQACVLHLPGLWRLRLLNILCPPPRPRDTAFSWSSFLLPGLPKLSPQNHTLGLPSNRNQSLLSKFQEGKKNHLEPTRPRWWRI